MSTQVNFVCWSSADVVATIPTEAATPSDEVLLATHAPLRITRRSGKSGHDAAEVAEETVLEEFLATTPNNGVLVAAVLGESGAGKSHLIRWLYAKIPEKPGRRIIYLQKTETSLKDIVERLLLDHQDPEFEELRRRVSGLGSGMTADEMEHKILAELAEALRTAQADTAHGKALVGDNGLRLFFTDPLFEKHLLREGSFIRRRAEHALNGRSVDEPDVPLEFTVNELPTDIADYANIDEAALSTQRLFRRVVANEAMQVEAVRLLNEVLDIAVTKAANLAVGDLSQAFKKIREKLVGQEILVLIEDVALIQGVRRDLLDAITEVSVVQGVERYATVRTLMAVTPGYYSDSLPETFRRRSEATSPVYVVDVDLDSAGVDEEDIVDFVGRYLNAARIGKADLETASPRVPNKCHDCEFRADCHAAFGTSRQEYGLYPYNRPAILRAVRACAEQDHDRVYFNPRKVLSRAVRHVLTDNIELIEKGEFPPSDIFADESLAMDLPQLPIHIRERIETDHSGEDAGRLEALITFWGSVGTEQIDDGVLKAFSHPGVPTALLDLKAEDDAEIGSGEEESGNGSRVPKSIQKQLGDVDAWSRGKTLPQGVASELRTMVREALLARVDWFHLVIKEPDASTLSKAIPDRTLISRSISIEGASENLPSGVEPIVRLKRSAQTARMFIGLIYIKAGFPERAGDAMPRLDAIVARSVDEARRRILSVLAVDDASLERAAASLIRGAAACGVLIAPKPKEIDFINACLWLPPTSDREDVAARAPAWADAYRGYVASREEAVRRLVNGMGAAQGERGAVHALDIHRFTVIVKKAARLASSEGDFDVPVWCTDTHRKLKQLSRAAAWQLAHWRTLVERARRHLPGNVSLAETADAITDAARVGQPHGFVKVPDLQRLSDLNAEARTWDGGNLRTVERLLLEAESAAGMELLQVVGTVAGADLPKITDYLESSATWVEAGLREADSGGGVVADLDVDIEKTIVRWMEIVKEATGE